MSIQPVEWDGVKTLENELLLSLEESKVREKKIVSIICSPLEVIN